MKKYLIPSLENQSCKNFIWVLLVGNNANITNIISKINLNISFEIKILFINNFTNYIRNISKGHDVLITTRIDYDDVIYFDAVNDVRKAVNMKKPMILYGYNRGILYFESNKKYYDLYIQSIDGCLGIFTSLILVLKEVNNPYTIFNIGAHTLIRKNLLNNYKSFGIKKIDYEPSIFDSGGPKFIYVRQRYSHNYNNTLRMKIGKKDINFNFNKLYNK